MLVPNLKSDLSQQNTILSVDENRGIDDLTNVPFPCYNIRVSNAYRRRVCRFNRGVKARGRGYKTVLSTPCSNSMLKPRFNFSHRPQCSK